MDSLYLAAEAASGLQLILPAPAELVYGAISFAAVYFVLSKFAFPKINTMLDDRAASIQGRMEEAETKLREAEETKADYQRRIDEAKSDANRIVDEARSTAESLRRDIVAKAEDEAKQILERAERDVAAERERALQELRAEVGAMSVQLAARIVEKELDATAHQALVDEYIQDLSRSN
jgi:F-type H+-transporting ATPase subunit b